MQSKNMHRRVKKISTIQIYEKSPYLVLVYEEKSWHSLLNDMHASKRS